MSTPEAKLALAQVERLIVEHTALSTEVVELRLEMIPLREANRALRAERDAALAEAATLRRGAQHAEGLIRMLLDVAEESPRAIDDYYAGRDIPHNCRYDIQMARRWLLVGYAPQAQEAQQP